MKKIVFVLSSLALLFGLTQCKKNLDTVNPAATGKVHITYSTGGSKTNISDAGVVTWTAGDVCHVYASTTGYLGALTLSAGAGTNTATFSGSLSEWTDNETLRFYYLGTNTKKADNTFVIDYSAQDGTLATIASKYHVSCYTEENVSASQTSFSGQMLNQMALAVFDVNGFGSGNVKIYAESGFRNMIKISSTGELSYGVAGINPDVDNLSGHIVIGAAGAKKYVALLPSDGDITMQFTSQSKTGSDEARTIAANDFIGSSAAVAITAADVVSDYVDLAVASNYVFTVASGRTVKFAKGNLVYDQGRFKMHNTQYGRCFTSEDGDVSSQTKVSGTFDLFGWGTAGWNNGNLLYMPYTLSKSSSSPYTSAHGYGYGPTDGSNYKIDLTGTYANSDWGVYQFGMDAESGWRTLTTGERQYLFNDRTGAGEKYASATVNSIPGIVLLPDTWTLPTGCSFKAGMNGWKYNTYDVDAWASMEANGAVFLPADGYRNGTGVVNVGVYGRYCSSSANEYNEGYAYCVNFNGNTVTPSSHRYLGQSVRLVR